MYRRSDYYPNNIIRYFLTEEEIYTTISFIKNHEREDIPEDVWDLCMKLCDAVEG